MKFENTEVVVRSAESRPVWGAWIEIDTLINTVQTTIESRPVWGAWIEI